MPNNIKTHIDRIKNLIDKLGVKSHKLQFDINNGIATAEVVELIEVQLKLKHLVEDLEHLNLSVDIAQEEIEKGTLDKSILDKLKSQLERDLPKVDSKIKSALRVEKQATELYNATKLEKKEQPSKKEEKKPEVKSPKKVEVKEIPEKKVVKSSEKIVEKKQEAISGIKEKVGQMGSASFDIFSKDIEKYFDFKAGKIVTDKNFIKQLNKLTVDVLDSLQSDPKFTGPVSQFVKRMPAISDAITDFQKTVNDIKVPAFETAKKIVIDEIIDKMLNNGLNQAFVQPLRDLIYQNVTSGLSLTDAKANIKEFIQGGKDVSGKLGQYVEQTAQQAVDSYSGAINTKLLQEFDYDGLLMTGTLIDNSSPQCRYVINELGGKITRKNWPEVKKRAEKHGLIEDTTFDNLPLNRLHWNCRHSFFPVIIKKVA